MPAQPEFQQRLKSIERLLGEIDHDAEPNLRSAVQQLLRLVMDLHGGGLERMLELISQAGDVGAGLIEKLTTDELVESLLVLHGLHPLSLEVRIDRALDKARGRLRPHRAELQLIGVQEGAVRLRLLANGHGCGSTAEALKEIVENAVYQAAPDIVSLVIEDAAEKQGFVPIEMLQRAPILRVEKGAL
ncbi:MAG: NifU family protein [Bryobacteraceae bacterium]|jgi:Fe-S cluster biogenesis protein NfuA